MIPERRMNMKNDDKLREQLNSEPVPDRLQLLRLLVLLSAVLPLITGITLSFPQTRMTRY